MNFYPYNRLIKLLKNRNEDYQRVNETIQVTRCELPDRAVFDHYIDSIYQSAWLTNRGSLVRQLEQQLQDYLGVKNLVLVANGTLALQVAMKLLDLSGEVITTPFSFIATSSSIVWNGLKPVFSDIDPQSLNIDPTQIEKHITENTSAILPVHVFGNPCDTKDIQEIANRYSLKVIYDAAHAFGVKKDNKTILNEGDVSILSFHATKLFHTGEGGALIIEDDDLCEKARKMINFGITGPESIECLGINAKMTELQAAMGLALLPEIDDRICKRGEISTLFDEALLSRIKHPEYMVEASKNFAYYPILLESRGQLKQILAAFNKEGIFPRRYFYPALNNLNFLPDAQCPVADSISQRILCLPLYSTLKKEDCMNIITTINKTLST